MLLLLALTLATSDLARFLSVKGVSAPVNLKPAGLVGEWYRGDGRFA
jgi:hypothetical protein